MSTGKENEARLSVATKAIEKEYGPVVKWLGEAAEAKRETLSTGCLGLDNAIGNGGLERGLVAEFFGRSGAGKSFLGYSLIKEACDKGYRCAIVDAENSLDPKLLIAVGLPATQVLVVDGAPTGEANLDIADNLMSTGQFAVVMIDSVAALIPESRVESDYNQQSIGLHARLMSAGVQKIQPIAKKTNTLLLFINQIRNKIGSYGNPETTTGGEALAFYASYQVEVIGSPRTKNRRLCDPGTGEVYGHKTTFRVVKNKRSAPYREAEVDLIYGLGYDTVGETIDLGVDVGLIDKGGAWLVFQDHKWQGRDKAKLALHADSGLQKEIEKQIRQVISGSIVEETTTVEAVPKEPEEPKVEFIKDNGEIKDDKPPRKKRARNADASVS